MNSLVPRWCLKHTSLTREWDVTISGSCRIWCGSAFRTNYLVVFIWEFQNIMRKVPQSLFFYRDLCRLNTSTYSSDRPTSIPISLYDSIYGIVQWYWNRSGETYLSDISSLDSNHGLSFIFDRALTGSCKPSVANLRFMPPQDLNKETSQQANTPGQYQ